MTYATTLDVQCPHPGCTYTGPAPLIAVAETEHWLEHWTCVCPTCGYGWIVALGGEE